MRALVTTPHGARLVDRPPPVAPPGWVRLDVRMAGVCRTDVAAARGALPVENGRILGHELAGRTPDGGLVSVRPRLPDGRFLGLQLDGAFAEQVVVPMSALVRLPEDMDLRRAAFVEPVAAATSVTSILPSAGRVALRGEGRIAELCRRVIQLLGVRLVDEDDGGIDVLVVTSVGPVLDLSGVRKGGRVVLKGRPAGPVLIDQRAIVERELTVQGVDYGDFDEAAALLASGELAVDDLFAEPVSLDRFAQAFEGREDRKNLLVPTR